MGICHPLILIPYYLRALRLHLVFKVNGRTYKAHSRSRAKKVTVRCAKESNLIKWTLICWIPFFVITIVSIAVVKIREGFPTIGSHLCNSSHVTQEEQSRNYAIVIVLYLVECYLFVLFIFLLKDVQVEFSISHELYLAAFAWIACSFLIFLLICLGKISRLIT